MYTEVCFLSDSLKKPAYQETEVYEKVYRTQYEKVFPIQR